MAQTDRQLLFLTAAAIVLVHWFDVVMRLLRSMCPADDSADSAETQRIVGGAADQPLADQRYLGKFGWLRWALHAVFAALFGALAALSVDDGSTQAQYAASIVVGAVASIAATLHVIRLPPADATEAQYARRRASLFLPIAGLCYGVFAAAAADGESAPAQPWVAVTLLLVAEPLARMLSNYGGVRLAARIVLGALTTAAWFLLADSVADRAD